MNHGLILGGFLLSVLLLIHFSSTRRPLSSVTPLNVDDDLPLPWAGYASSAFSLSGLFGAFLGIFLLLGWGALFGIAIGVAAALLIVRDAIARADPETFEDFLRSRRFCTARHHQLLLWSFLGILQLWFAASELIILREVAVLGLGLSPRHSTALALSLSLIVYFYCLLGGYDAVFRSDVLQFAGLFVMCFWISILTINHPIETPLGSQPMSQEYWSFGLALSPPSKLVSTMLIGIPIGATGLLGTPATWKRIFISIRRGTKYNSFSILVFAGILPFLLLTPVLWRLRHAMSQELPLDFLFTLDNSRSFSLAILIGMTCAFMSSFNSSIVAATHIFITRPVSPTLKPKLVGIGLYRAALCSGYAIIVFLGLAVFNQAANPYLVGNLMVGPFCILGGLVLGTQFLEHPFDGGRLLGIISVVLVGWFVYMAHFLLEVDAGSAASPAQVESMPIGATLFVLTAVLARAFRKRSS